MEREDCPKRKGARNHGKVLSFHGGKLTKRASLKWNRQVVLTIQFQDGVLFLVQYMAVARLMMAGTGIPHRGLSPAFSTPQREWRMRYLIFVLSNLSNLMIFKPMDLSTW
jgi:hypothetical protein